MTFKKKTSQHFFVEKREAKSKFGTENVTIDTVIRRLHVENISKSVNCAVSVVNVPKLP